MRSFNVYDFENYLIVEFIAGKTLTEITAHLDRRLQYDPDFAKRYEKWQKITNQNSWLNLYETLNDNEENLLKKLTKTSQ
jgi:hypothetical protein